MIFIKPGKSFLVCAGACSIALLMQTVFTPSLATAQLTKVPGGARVPCDVAHQLGCPDYQGTIAVNGYWDPPKPGYLGLVEARKEYAAALGQQIDVLWYRPAYPEYDSRIHFQALNILKHLQKYSKLTGKLVLARAYWTNGSAIKVDNYIFLKDASTGWHRNRSAALVNQLITANL
jgi:hypothetical protein